MRSTFRIRGWRIGSGSAKAIVIPRSLIAFTPAKRTRAMNATRVFAGATSYGPQACHMFLPTNRRPHLGHVHSSLSRPRRLLGAISRSAS